MKFSTCIASLCLLFVVPLGNAAPANGFSISEKGPHHRVWSKTVEEQRPNSGVIKRQKSYTELATGMHYWSDEQKDWIESDETIEVINGTGVARHGQHQVIWAANANSFSAVDLQSSDGKRFRSHVLGLAFTDTKSGASFFFATIQDSIGEIVGNQVFYKNAFNGAKADLVYTYRRERFEQDIVLREALPDPSGPPWNMNPDTVLVEIYTEFIDPPEPVIQSFTVASESDPAAGRAIGRANLIDQQLDFGAMKIGAGSAFAIGTGEVGRVPIVKSFEVRDQRHVLIEKIQYSAAKKQLAALETPALPTREQVAAIEAEVRRDKSGVAHSALPKRSEVAAKPKTEPMRIAQIAIPTRGLVLDYSQVNTSSNMTFNGDTTYYVSGAVTLTGTTTIEGNCVVKYAPTNGASIQVNGQVVCLTGPFKMAVFTARDDHTIGEQIGTNSITGVYATTALALNGSVNPNPFTLSYIRIGYAATALDFSHGFGHLVSHSQLVHCDNAFTSTSTDFSFRNVLTYSISNMCSASGLTTTGRWEHVTLDTVKNFNNTTNGSFFLTNCLLVAVTNTGPYSGSSNASTNAPANAFQAVGAGLHYLPTNSPYRNVGTTNINPALLAQLRKTTTAAPVIKTNSVTANTTWSTQAQRDTDTPDIGYHYSPIDYACNTVIITNATLTLGVGTCVAGFDGNALWVQDGGSLISEGNPTNHNVIGRYNSAQEQSTTWGAPLNELVTGYHYGNAGGSGRLRFTDVTTPPGQGYLFYSEQQWSFGSLVLRDSEFNIGSMIIGGTSNSTYSITNNLFFRLLTSMSGDCHVGAYNNLFYRGYTSTDNAGATANWLFKDNAFDGGTVDDTANTTNGFNGYINTSGYLSPGPANGDLVLTNFVYATGPLGYFYQYSTNLSDKGSVTNAGLRGLYHYTTQTNEVKEANSKLDIGYHYVAGDSVTGVSIDTDGDGTPDAQEDANGNGVFDAGETDWLH